MQKRLPLLSLFFYFSQPLLRKPATRLIISVRQLIPALSWRAILGRSGQSFHAGFDIKTNGKEGMPVYAVADGYIPGSRFRRMVTEMRFTLHIPTVTQVFTGICSALTVILPCS